MDQVDRTHLAMFAVWLYRKLSRSENDGVLVCVVLVMKEASPDLTEKQRGEDQ